MKIYIIADMEGISGIPSEDYVTPSGRNYHLGRRFYTWDINACVQGCFEAGADSVIVRDGHSNCNHVLWEELDSRVELIQGTGHASRFPGLDECDAMILLGCHAMAGTADGLLAHTLSSTVHNAWLNERLAGEIAIVAGVAADYTIPTIMISGDDKACQEASTWIPEIVTCRVKIGLSNQSARLLPMAKAHSLIHEKAAEAVRKVQEIHAIEITRPLRLRVEVDDRVTIHNLRSRPEIQIIDGRTFEVTSNTVEEALQQIG